MVNPATRHQQVAVCIGQAGLPVGTLDYRCQGRREASTFAYDASWLGRDARFNVSADLAMATKCAKPQLPAIPYSTVPLRTPRPMHGAGAS